tara:strand:- start:2796 stop:2936 length:141 start_codon:yes stop_codon:yes gene_type:complete
MMEVIGLIGAGQELPICPKWEDLSISKVRIALNDRAVFLPEIVVYR